MTAQPTIWQQNAAAFATRPTPAIDMERRLAVRAAGDLIVRGRSARALYELARSVERQVRMAGAGSHVIEPTCPCGGRCDHGRAIECAERCADCRDRLTDDNRAITCTDHPLCRGCDWHNPCRECRHARQEAAS